MKKKKQMLTPTAFREKFTETSEHWEAYCLARALHDEAVAEEKRTSKEMRVAEAKLRESMVDNGVNSVPDELATAFTSSQWSMKCNQDNRHDVNAFLIEWFGDVEIFKTYVLDKSSVVAKIRECCEAEPKDDDPRTQMCVDDLPDSFEFSDQLKINVRGWEAKKRAILDAMKVPEHLRSQVLGQQQQGANS